MGEDRVARLTEGQRACLRMVLQHMSSKDIARALDVSPHTVDQRLKVAIRTLGVASRVEAARMLAAVEDGEPHQRLVHQRPDIDPQPARPSWNASALEGQRTADKSGDAPEAAYDAASRQPAAVSPLPPLAREVRHHERLRKIGW